MDKYITLAIHTYEHAVALRKILQNHGIDVQFERLVTTGAPIVSAIRVRIKESELPLALKITESGDMYSPLSMQLKFEGTNGNILIPVDFSANSMMSCRIGFDLARRLSLHPVIMHAYTTPYFYGAIGSGDSLGGGIYPDVPEEMSELEAGIDLRKESEKLMKSLRDKIEDAQKEGAMPAMKFTTTLSEGVPEDVIKDYCRLTPPVVVVMATRGKEKRDEALIGSVTAEVLDSCRVPVFTVPENCNMVSVEDVRKLVYFCNLDQQDIISVDTLMRMFDYPEADITLVPVNDRAGANVREKVGMLRDYFNKSYPASNFSVEVFPSRSFRENLENFLTQTGVELLIVPNKKRNIFSRLFNPGIAHKLLFERDMPMLVFPV